MSRDPGQNPDRLPLASVRVAGARGQRAFVDVLMLDACAASTAANADAAQLTLDDPSWSRDWCNG
jgi:hypothetical protein